MSRGLSQQQKSILAVALHVNKRTNGGSVALRTGKHLKGYLPSVIDYAGIKDLNWPIAAHVIGDLKFGGIGDYFDLTNSHAKSVKASTIRAISTLLRGGFLAYSPKSMYQIHSVCGQYTLTQLGIDTALVCDSIEFDDSVIIRAGLCVSGGWQFPNISLPELMTAMDSVRLPLKYESQFRIELAKHLNVSRSTWHPYGRLGR